MYGTVLLRLLQQHRHAAQKWVLPLEHLSAVPQLLRVCEAWMHQVLTQGFGWLGLRLANAWALSLLIKRR